MRQISSSLSTLQQQTGRTPAYQVLKEEWFWKFYQQYANSSVVGLIDKTIPQPFIWDGTQYSLWGHDSSTGYSINYLISPTGMLNGSTVYPSGCRRGAYLNGILYFASGSPYSLKRIGDTGSINTNLEFSNSSSLITRMEAVAPVIAGSTLSTSTIFYAYGTHDLSQKISNISYYFYQNGISTKLRTIVQMPPDVASPTSWSKLSSKASNFFAIQTNTDEYLLAAQDNQAGRVIIWTMKGGVESQTKIVVPIDHDLDNIDFTLSGLYKINGLYYLTGMFTRNMLDGTKVSYNCYFRSKDGWNWSIGEKAHFINAEENVGCFDSNYSGSGVLRWMGANTVYTASSLQSGIDITDKLYNFEIVQKSVSGDTLKAEFEDSVAKNDILTFKIGYYDDSGIPQLTQVEKFAVDDVKITMQESGRSAYSISGRDYATACLSSNIPIDYQRDSTLAVDSTIVNFDNLICRLFPDRVIATSSPLLHKGLNAPSIFYDAMEGRGDGIVRATVSFENVTNYCQQSISLLFGLSETNFTAIVFPRASTWTGAISGSQVRNSNITSWDQTSGLLPFISKATKLPDHQGTTTTLNGVSIAPSSNIYYDFAVRTNGNRFQLFYKQHDIDPSTIAGNAGWIYISEYKLSERQMKTWADSSYCGLALSTDVPASKEWFTQSAYGDLTVQLTEANEASKFKTKAGETVFTRLINSPKNGMPGEYWEGYEWSASSPGWVNVGPDISKFQLGLAMKFHIFETQISKTHIDWGWVHAIDIPNQRIQVSTDGITPKTAPFTSASGSRLSLYLINPAQKSDIHAVVHSGYKVDTVFNVPVTTSNTITKFPDSVGGRAAFITDTSVFAPRWVKTDGITTTLRSSSPTSLVGFEQTTPVNVVYDAESQTWNYWDVRNWRMVFHHGLFFEGTCGSKNLPVEGVFEVNDELILFKEYSFNRSGVYPLLGDTDAKITWCAIPTLYSSLNAASANSSVLSTWFNGGSYVGDNLSNSEGYLAEIVSRDSSGLTSIFEEGEQYYCQFSSDHSITLDKPYPNEIIGVSSDPLIQKKADLLVLSGRGWKGTRKSLHPYDSVVKLYPSTTKVDAFIRLKHFSSARGLYNSSTTDLITTLATYGVFNVKTGRLGTVTSIGNFQTLLASSIADFECIFNGHISNSPISFNFRNYYQLDVYGEYTGGRSKLVLELHAPNDSSIQPGPKRYLEHIRVDVSDFDCFTNSSLLHQLRLIVKGDFIQVEFQGQLIWRFHLNEHVYKSVLAGNVYVSSQIAQAGIEIYIPEMGDEMESHIIDLGMAGTEALGYVIQERYLKTRATSDGGIYSSRFLVRETAGYTLGDLIVQDSQLSTGTAIPAHIRVTGAEIGETLDGDWIRENGYQFATGQNRLANTVTESAAIAKILKINGIESTFDNEIDTHFYTDLEVEDKIPVIYMNLGDIYSRSISQTETISGITILGTQNSLSAIYYLRQSYV